MKQEQVLVIYWEYTEGKGLELLPAAIPTENPEAPAP